MDQAAVLRPGRFGKLMYVPLQNQDERGLILKALSRNKPLDDDVDLIAIARSKACANMNEAAMAAVEEKFSQTEAASHEGTSESHIGGMPHTIKAVHFQQALEKISPSISDKKLDLHLKS